MSISTPNVATNVRWHSGKLSPEERTRALGQVGAVVWFTGLSGAGKSTVARELEASLLADGRFVYVLDGDNLRHGLNADLGFSEQDRKENIRRIAEVARLFADAGVIVLCAVISPFRADRAFARSLLPNVFVEVWCRADLAVCESRDVKGLYRKARAGEISDFTGISSPYEAPDAAELELDTGVLPLAEAVAQLRALLTQRGIL